MEVTSKMLIYFVINKIQRKVTEVEKGSTSKPVKNYFPTSQGDWG